MFVGVRDWLCARVCVSERGGERDRVRVTTGANANLRQFEDPGANHNPNPNPNPNLNPNLNPNGGGSNLRMHTPMKI